MSRKPIIAIDGPAGAGKGTVSRLLADRLGYQYIDTGAMYRAVALFAERQNIDWEDETGVASVVPDLDFVFTTEEHRLHVAVNGEDVTDTIRQHHMSHGASVVARYEKVVDELRDKQRELGELGGIVMEGRNICSYVFPDAEIKIYLTATPEERARRRVKQLEEQGKPADYQEILDHLIERDKRDSGRPHAPLIKTDDAIEVLTDNKTIEQVVAELESLVKKNTP
jgi:cytidylate kinase